MMLSSRKDYCEDKSVVRDSTRSFLSLRPGIELSASVPFNVVFLHPTRDENVAEERSERESIVVTITVTVPADIRAPKPIESLVAEIIGYEVLAFTLIKSEVNNILYCKNEAEGAHGLQLEPGQTYRWDFTLQLNNNDTPREYIGSSSVHQAIVIRLTWADQSLQKRYKDLEVKRRLYVLCVSNRYNNLAYFRLHQSVIDRLGPMVALFKTPNFTIGGHIHIGLFLASMPPDCSLQAVEVNVLQQVSLISRQRIDYQEDLPLQSINILYIKQDELHAKIDIEQGSFRDIWITRIGPSDRVRPSTLKGSKSNIILAHKLEFKIHYTFKKDEKTKPLIYTALWPITVASCGCRMQDLKLPSYQDSVVESSSKEVDEPPSAFFSDSLEAQVPEEHACICCVSISQLLEQDEDYKMTKDWSVKDRLEREIKSQRTGQDQDVNFNGTQEENAAADRLNRQEVDERKARQLYRPASGQ